jgi:predicted PurR-regulated permease PerM
MVVAILIVGVAYLLWRGAYVLVLGFAGVLFAVFLSALSDWVSRRTGLPRAGAPAIVVVVLVLLVGGVGFLLANSLAAQTAELAHKLPESFRQIRDYLSERDWGRLLLEKAPQAAESLAQPGEFSRVTGLVAGVADFLVAVIVVCCVGIFGAAEPAVYRAGLLHLVPHDQRRRVSQAVDEVALDLRGWIVGQVFLMVLMGVMTAVGLSLLGIPWR